MYDTSSFFVSVIKTTLQGSGRVAGSMELCSRKLKNYHTMKLIKVFLFNTSVNFYR